MFFFGSQLCLLGLRVFAVDMNIVAGACFA